ncbi:MAG: TIM barrel protein [Firmicutes bacterium]|nr:TIM barrel protein [Bacillota bacterium]
MIRFGPAGNDLLFYESGFKSSLEAPKWLREVMGLSAFEVQWGRGVRLSEITAKKMAKEAKKYDIEISAHAPYYINLANNDAFENNYRYISTSLQALKWLGGTRLVVHLASQGQLSREVALANISENLKKIMQRLEHDGFSQFLLCIETMGKYRQIGNLEEVAQLSKVHPNIIPCVDFGHLNCLAQGNLDIPSVMEYLEQEIGLDKLRKLHIHWSAIEFGEAGEKRHTILDDKKWAFSFEPLVQIIKDKNLSPVIICESSGIMAQDATKLMDTYYRKPVSKLDRK